MNEAQIKNVESISSEYLDICKPLLQMLKVRMKGRYPTNCLNEIRAINDHIARCYRSGVSEDDITKELGKAEGHLLRLAYDCYKQIILYQVADIKKTVKYFYSSRWLHIGNGELWRCYLENYKSAFQDEKQAKRHESIDPDEALKFYESAVNKYGEILLDFKKYKWQICLSAVIRIFERITKGVYWLIVTFTLAVVAAILAWLDIY